MNADSPLTIKNGPNSTASLIPIFIASSVLIFPRYSLLSLVKPIIPLL